MEKKRLNISLKGINTSMSDLAVPDGACEELRNLRWRDGAWQKVGNPKLVENIALPDSLYNPDTFSLLYIHEVEGVNHYVCEGEVKVDTGENFLYQIHLFVYANGVWADLGSYAEHYNNQLLEADIKVTSFGKVLIVTANGVMQNFVWSNDAYHLFAMPAPVTITEDVSDVKTSLYDYADYSNNARCWKFMDYETKEFLLPTGDYYTGYWRGEICYLVAYRMKDGTILSPSNLRILCSEGDIEENVSSSKIALKTIDEKDYYALCMYQSDVNFTDPERSTRLQSFRPTLTISIPDVSTDLIDRVALYATRVNNILDVEKIAKLSYPVNGVPYYEYYANNRLPEQPFYLVEEMALTDIENNSWEVRLGYDKLANLATKSQTYQPILLHSISAETTYDYNHRMHFANLTTTLYSHQPNFELTADPITQASAGVRERVTLEDINAYALSAPLIEITQDQSAVLHPYSSIISYPDERASKLEIAILWQTIGYGTYSAWQFTLRPATANNFAYYIFPPSPDGKKYPLASITCDSRLYSPSISTLSPTFTEPNRIQVSAINNPFSLPFANSYAVGNEGSRVLAMNTIADSLVDSTFYGNYPLYIFTSDGIFAFRAGSGEILYAGTENINHDRLIDSTTIALNGSVVYPCKEGLKALSGRTAVRISADIDTNLGIWDDWSGLEMAVNWRFNELYCVKKDGRVFVWNVESGAWSTRDDITGNLRQGYIAEVGNTLDVYDINEEVMSDMFFRLVTRPLKLGSVNAFKKLSSMIVRVNTHEYDMSFSIKVEGSNDLSTWRILREVTGNTAQPLGILRFPQSSRFIRVSFSGRFGTYATFEGIDIDFVEKYARQLR